MALDDFLFEIPTAPGAFRVISVLGEEGLSIPFRFEIEALLFDGGDGEVERGMLGQIARLRLRRHDGTFRSIFGAVRSMRFLGGAEVPSFRLEVVPAFWRFGDRFRKRIFQNLDVPAIVAKVLLGHQIPNVFRLSRRYLVREYCVQYDESDVDFVARILADEGIFYFFESTDDATRMVFGDNPNHYDAIDGVPVLVHRDVQISSNEEQVSGFFVERTLRPAKVALRDFDYRNPTLALNADDTVALAPDGELPLAQAGQTKSVPLIERYEFPGGFVDSQFVESSEGPVRAQDKLDALRWDAEVGTGRSSSRRLEPGHHFTLVDHPRATFNKDWVVTRVRHEGHAPGASLAATASKGADEITYRASFECIPRVVVFRPAPLPQPRVHGIETATVNTFDDSEIEVDADGRVRVLFWWDREQNDKGTTTCFLRVAHFWAGAGFGATFLPRNGMEVVVSFLGGNPDRPVITGYLYNQTHPNPYKLPEHKTRSTIRTRSSPGGEGFNELRFEDKTKAEEIFIHAQKDMNEVIRDSHTESVGGSEAISVGHDQATKVGHDQTVEVGNNQHTKIVNALIVQVGGSRRTDVTGNARDDVAGHEVHKALSSRTTVIGGPDHHSSGEFISKVQGEAKLGVTGSYEVNAGAVSILGGHGAPSQATLFDSFLHLDSKKIQADGSTLVSLRSDGKVLLHVGDGATRVEVTPTEIKIHADVKVTVDASSELKIHGGSDVSITSDGSLTINAATGLKIHGATVDVTGDVKING